MSIKIERLTPEYFEGFFELINQFRPCNIKTQVANNVQLSRDVSGIHTFVAVQDGIVLGTASLWIEQKFINNGGRVGHIEDVVVHEEFRGCGVGAGLVQHCIDYAKERQCYKTILDCSKDLEQFYSKIGMQNGNIQMEIRH